MNQVALTPIRRRIEHVDTDASGVVHFARYPSLLETALLENLERLGVGLTALAQDGLDLVVVDLTMHYRVPAGYAEQVRLEIAVGHLGAAKVRIDGTVHRAEDGVELATGTIALAVVDRATGAPRALPAALNVVLTEAQAHGIH